MADVTTGSRNGVSRKVYCMVTSRYSMHTENVHAVHSICTIYCRDNKSTMLFKTALKLYILQIEQYGSTLHLVLCFAKTCCMCPHKLKSTIILLTYRVNSMIREYGNHLVLYHIIPSLHHGKSRYFF